MYGVYAYITGVYRCMYGYKGCIKGIYLAVIDEDQTRDQSVG